MTAEHVRISSSENYFAQKNLLHSQLELLDLIKRIRNFKLLRNEELLLKIALKQKIKEASESVEELNKILPVSHFKEEPGEKEPDKKKHKREKIYSTLQDEIALIQEKLSKLQDGM